MENNMDNNINQHNKALEEIAKLRAENEELRKTHTSEKVIALEEELAQKDQEIKKLKKEKGTQQGRATGYSNKFAAEKAENTILKEQTSKQADEIREELINKQISPAIRAEFDVKDAKVGTQALRTNYSYKKLHKEWAKLQKKGENEVGLKVANIVLRIEKCLQDKDPEFKLTEEENKSLTKKITKTINEKDAEFLEANKKIKKVAAYLIVAGVVVVSIIGACLAFSQVDLSRTRGELGETQDTLSKTQDDLGNTRAAYDNAQKGLDDANRQNAEKDAYIQALEEIINTPAIAITGQVDVNKLSNALTSSTGGKMDRIVYANYEKSTGRVRIVAEGTADDMVTKTMSLLECHIGTGKTSLTDQDVQDILVNAKDKGATVYVGEKLQGYNETMAFTSTIERGVDQKTVQVKLFKLIEGELSIDESDVVTVTKDSGVTTAEVEQSLTDAIIRDNLTPVEKEA